MKSQEWTKLFINGTGEKVLDSMNIYCPNNTAPGFNNDCFVTVISGDNDHYMLEEIIIYAIEGDKDIHIQCQYDTGSMWENCFAGIKDTLDFSEYPWLRMHCGSQYQYFCDMSMINTTSIADELIYLNETCKCAQLTTIPSISPTALILSDTMIPTSSPTTNQPSVSPNNINNKLSTTIPSIPPSLSPTYASFISNPTSIHVTEPPSTNGDESGIGERNTTKTQFDQDTAEEISKNNMVYWIITAILIYIFTSVIIMIIVKAKNRKSDMTNNCASSNVLEISNTKDRELNMEKVESVSHVIENTDLQISSMPESPTDENVVHVLSTGSIEGETVITDIMMQTEEILMNDVNVTEGGMSCNDDYAMSGIIDIENDPVMLGEDEIVTKGKDDSQDKFR